jgi:muramoyltetrapeptide carboxypeptidase
VNAAAGWLLPRGLHPGDLVGICAPSGAVDGARLVAGVSALEGLGFRVRGSEGILERALFTAGSPKRRADELHALFEDPDVAAVFCARGGAGAIELLVHLEPLLFRRNPKSFVGYSDATLLHSLLNRLGLVTFHGPMVAAELALGSYDAAALGRALCDGQAPWSVEAAGLRPLRAGEARGRLRGGCLSLLAAAIGTGWEPAPPDPDEGAILLVEDASEPPYRVHRLLSQLAQSGALRGVGGIVFGEMRGCAPGADEAYTLEDVLLHALEGFAGPVAIGLPCGHSPSPMLTLPLGAPARLSCGPEARLDFEGPWLS